MDQQFLGKLVAMFRDGSFGSLGPGVLDPQKLIPSGYSSGAQMSSWLIELQARGNLPEGSGVSRPFPSWSRSMLTEIDLCHVCSCPEILRVETVGQVVAAAFVAGGSHMCYQDPPLALSQCRNCTASGNGHGCSTEVAAGGQPPICSFCCPTGVTELYYRENPASYDTHPPCFLAQTAPDSSDFNADLCAAKNYYDTLKTHSVDAAIVYLSGSHIHSYCVGNDDNQAAQGSPYLGTGAGLPATGFLGPPCVDHVAGEPAVSILESVHTD
jgi:hypothetical protein